MCVWGEYNAVAGKLYLQAEINVVPIAGETQAQATDFLKHITANQPARCNQT